MQYYRGGIPASRVQRHYQQAVQQVALATQFEQARLHAMATSSEFGMIRYVQVKRLQSDLEHLCPDAAEGLAAFTNNALLDMMRSVQQFGQGIA